MVVRTISLTVAITFTLVIAIALIFQGCEHALLHTDLIDHERAAFDGALHHTRVSAGVRQAPFFCALPRTANARTVILSCATHACNLLTCHTTTTTTRNGSPNSKGPPCCR